MRSFAPLLLSAAFLPLGLSAGDQAKKPPLKITPGKAIVPTDAMRRIWGELLTLDLKSRTGTFRNESNDEVMSFTVLPYAELLHHAAFGDLQDFKIGECAIFRLATGRTASQRSSRILLPFVGQVVSSSKTWVSFGKFQYDVMFCRNNIPQIGFLFVPNAVAEGARAATNDAVY